MTTPPDGGPAFPCLHPDTTHRYADTGMTIRAYLAGLALQGMCADTHRQGTPDEYAALAVELADALIAALAK